METENATITRLADSYERLQSETFDQSSVTKPFWSSIFDWWNKMLFEEKTEIILVEPVLFNQSKPIPAHLNGIHLHTEPVEPKLTEVCADAELFHLPPLTEEEIYLILNQN